MTLHEPAVALTDFGLAVECALFVRLLGRAPRPALASWWRLFFAAAGLASLFGAAVHGLFAGPAPAREALWLATLLAVGGAGYAGAALAARLSLPARAVRVAVTVATALAVVYGAVVLAGEARFGLAVAAYLPSVLFLGGAFAIRAARRRPGAATGLAGVLVTLAAAGVQQSRVAIHPVHFDHNALYHVVQGIGLYLLFRAARETPRSTAASAPRTRPPR